MSTVKKISLVIAGLVVGFLIAVFWIYSNLSSLTRQVVEKEIPGLTFSELDMGWNSVHLSGVTYSPDAKKVLLKTDAIQIRPSLMSIFRDTFTISSILIEKPFLYVQRRRGGEVILPIPVPPATTEGDSLGPKKAPPDQGPGKAVHIGNVQIKGGSAEFVDRSVGRPYAHYKLRDLNVTVSNLEYPQTSIRIPVALSLIVEGKSEGQLAESGWVNPVAQSANLDIDLRNLYLPHAEPYYRSQVTTAKLSDGILSMKAKLDMDQGAFTFSGTITLADLKFADSSGEFFGVPTPVVEKYLEDQEKPLIVPFEIKGNLNQKTDYKGQMVRIVQNALIKELGAGHVEQALDKLKRGDIEGAEEDVKKLEERFKEIKGLFK